MSRQYCFLCASDEGVFLDITSDNRTAFSDQIETCLPTKINECIDLSNKICYKCAYELDHCTKFVQKYNKSQEISEPEDPSMSCCSLCYELVDSDRIFDITKDSSNIIFNPLQKIRNIFNNGATKRTNNIKLICLTCRYNLDVLYDLRKIYQETIISLKSLINEEINYSNFPKVHTDVVNRKTTITTFPDITICGSVNSSDSETNENKMTHGKRRVKRRKTLNSTQDAGIKLQSTKSSSRHCDKCHNAVARGVDMYRFYHTGLTVCKNCWLTEDPSSNKTRRSRTQYNLAGTKLCTVFLTDVLNQKSHTKKKTQAKEKDKDDNTWYDSLHEETRSSGSSVSFNTKNNINGKTKKGRKREIESIESKPLKMTRSNKECVKTTEVKSTETSDAEQQFSTPLVRKGNKRMMEDKNSDSDSSSVQKGAHKSKDNIINQSHTKKRKLSKGVVSINLDSSDDTSNEEGMSLRSKIKSTSSSLLTFKKENEAVAVKRSNNRTKSSSTSNMDTALSTDNNSKSVAQSEVKIEYSCSTCSKKFDTKVSNEEHKLTHFKQAALMLEKLTISSIKEETKVNSQDDEVFKEEESLPDKHADDPSEEISISIDDTDEEEIFNVPTNKKRKDMEKKKISSKDDNVSGDERDMTRYESPVKESANIENIKTKEFEQCEKLTTIEEEMLALDIENKYHKEDDKDEEDKNTVAEHTTEDRNKTSPNKESDQLKDTDDQKISGTTEDSNQDEEEDKNEQEECNIEVTSLKNTVTEYNNKEENDKKESNKEENDKKESHKEENDKKESNKEENDEKEITFDREICMSSILLKHNSAKDMKDQSKSCNNLENKFEDDKDKVIEKTEISQCDLVHNLSRKNIEELEKNKKTEILNDERELNDILIKENGDKELENLQNEVDEEDMEKMEVEADIHEFDSTKITSNSDFHESNCTKDTINLDLLNGDKTKNSDENVSVSANNNDDKVKSKKIKEKETNDLKEKQKFEEIKELDEIVDDNAVNKLKKIQESCCALDNNSIDAANEILKEVFELAAAEVQYREENNAKSLDIEMETLENISREIRKSADMPSLDPINVMEIDIMENDITLN